MPGKTGKLKRKARKPVLQVRKRGPYISKVKKSSGNSARKKALSTGFKNQRNGIKKKKKSPWTTRQRNGHQEDNTCERRNGYKLLDKGEAVIALDRVVDTRSIEPHSVRRRSNRLQTAVSLNVSCVHHNFPQFCFVF